MAYVISIYNLLLKYQILIIKILRVLGKIEFLSDLVEKENCIRKVRRQVSILLSAPHTGSFFRNLSKKISRYAKLLIERCTHTSLLP